MVSWKEKNVFHSLYLSMGNIKKCNFIGVDALVMILQRTPRRSRLAAFPHPAPNVFASCDQQHPLPCICQAYVWRVSSLIYSVTSRRNAHRSLSNEFLQSDILLNTFSPRSNTHSSCIGICSHSWLRHYYEWVWLLFTVHRCRTTHLRSNIPSIGTFYSTMVVNSPQTSPKWTSKHPLVSDPAA